MGAHIVLQGRTGRRSVVVDIALVSVALKADPGFDVAHLAILC